MLAAALPQHGVTSNCTLRLEWEISIEGEAETRFLFRREIDLATIEITDPMSIPVVLEFLDNGCGETRSDLNEIVAFWGRRCLGETASSRRLTITTRLYRIGAHGDHLVAPAEEPYGSTFQVSDFLIEARAA
ncbi:MAG: hypothetical protein AAGA35_02590 [Patescibacteria group bacterium]